MRLREERRKLGLSAINLGKELGCSGTVIYKIEAKYRPPSQQMAHKLEEYFNIPIEELLEGEINTKEYQPAEYALYKGETLLVIGTRAEIANELGIDRDTVTFYGTPSYKKRIKSDRNRRVLVRLDDDD